MPPPAVEPVGCPKEKAARPDFAELAQSKRRLKESLAAIPAAPEQIPVATAAQLARQRRFLEVVDAKRASLDSLPLEERERVYDQLKQSAFAE